MAARLAQSSGPASKSGCMLRLALLVASVAVPPGRATADSVEDIVSSTVRRHGHACKAALSAKRDADRSNVHTRVWVLQCSNASYRVEYGTDRRTLVQPLE